MATPEQVLLGTLEDLGEDDFKKFKWLLLQEGVLEGFPAIRKSRLENADRMDTVDQMVQTYCINTIKVTRMVLREINQNILMEKLSNTISEPIGMSLHYIKKKDVYYVFLHLMTDYLHVLYMKMITYNRNTYIDFTLLI